MPDVKAVRRHYNLLSIFYHLYWGEHIHHGYWYGDEDTEQAQCNLIRRLSDRAELDTGMKVLDIGCGLGGSALWLAEHRRCRVEGLTISRVQARLAEMKRRCRRIRQVRFLVQDANDLSALKSDYDCVWIIECSEHLTDKARFFRQCRDRLRPGGRLVLCSWLKGRRADQHMDVLEEICRAMLCPMLLTGDELVRCIRDAGMSWVRMESITDHVKQTWDICTQIARKRLVRALLPLMGPGTTRFVRSFDLMKQAYDQHIMEYGMFTAVKAES